MKRQSSETSKNYSGNIIVAAMLVGKTPLNVKGSRITDILGGAERGIKTAPEDPPRALMGIFWGQRDRTGTSPLNGTAKNP